MNNFKIKDNDNNIQEKEYHLWKKIILLVFYVIVITINVLSSFSIFNSTNLGNVTQIYPTSIIPDGITFSIIWTIIYFFYGFYIIYQFFSSFELLFQKEANEIFPYLVIIFFCNITWILLWIYNIYWTSLLIILLYLYANTKIYFFLNVQDTTFFSFSWKKIVFILGFVNTNFSWILVATITNFTTILKISGWNVPNDWSIACIVFDTLFTIWIISFYLDPYFAFVSIWTLLGIARNQQKNFSIQIISYIFAILLIFYFVTYFLFLYFTKNLINNNNKLKENGFIYDHQENDIESSIFKTNTKKGQNKNNRSITKNNIEKTRTYI